MKVYNIFVGKPQWEGGWPYVGFDNEALKNSILDKLKEKFPDLEFLGGEMIEKYEEESIRDIKKSVKNSHGLIIHTIGHYGDPGPIEAAVELIEQGIPTILSNYIYGGDHYFVQIYNKIKEKDVRVLPVSSPDFGDLEDAVETMYRINGLSGEKILNYTLDEIKTNLPGRMKLIEPELEEPEKEIQEYIEKLAEITEEEEEFYMDLEGIDQAHQWRRDEEKYRKNLADVLGMEMIRPDPKELWESYQEADEEEAKRIADKWIENAGEVVPRRETILSSAKLYIAMRNLMERHEANAITADCGTLMFTGFMPAIPCLPFHQLWNQGQAGVCESDMDSAVSSLLGRCLTGRPGFISNHSYDLENDRITYMHCMCSNELYGPDEPPLEYDIVRHGESHVLGASIWLDFPVGEEVTTIKVSMLEKKIAIRSGKIVESVKDEKGCRSKMVVETDVEKILENYDYQTFGWHRITFLGDWRKEIKETAKLLGLEVVEEDS